MLASGPNFKNQWNEYVQHAVWWRREPSGRLPRCARRGPLGGKVGRPRQASTTGDHFQYDPAKSDAYVATTLAWLCDPAAESYARHVLADLSGAASARPRRIASANLDLGLALIAADQPDEAAGVALVAVESGRLVPSNCWRVAEAISGIEGRDASDAARVHEAFRDTYPAEPDR